MKKPKCPCCQTDVYIVPEAWGEKVGTVVGGGVGLGLAISQGASAGALIATNATAAFPVPARILSTAGGAMIGGLAGGISLILGCSALGRQIGLEVDEHLIKAYRCNRCNTTICA